jgi:hypothetical protein
MVATIVAVTYLHDHHGEPHELREIHTRIPIILPEKHHDAWLSFEPEKSFGLPPQRAIYAKKNRTSSKKVWSNGVIFIVTIVLRRMRKSKNASTMSRIKPEIRTWYAFEGPLGDVIHNKRFFFAWKEGCLMGTYNSLEEATASLTSKQRRDIR